VLVGASYGGAVALEAALQDARAERRVCGLILLAPAAVRFDAPPEYAWVESPILRAMCIDLGTAELLADLRMRTAFHDDASIPTALEREYEATFRGQECRRTALAAAEALFAALDREQACEERFAELRLPALIIRGDDDRTVPREAVERLASLLPRDELHVLSDCGHAPAEERPNATLAAMKPFLDTLRQDVLAQANSANREAP
jgi:pimeloyl-ACP methyl ester carboxylesterase